MDKKQLTHTDNNVYFPNIHILRKYIQIINDYNVDTHSFNDDYFDFCFDNDYEYKRNYDSSMTNLVLYYYEAGTVIFKLSLNNMTFSSYFNEDDEKLISNFLKSDFSIDFEVFKKRRMRQIKIKKII